MAYDLAQMKDSEGSIKEQRWMKTTKGSIKFTVFDSCLGVVGKEGSTLTAVHLVRIGSENALDEKASGPARKGVPFDTTAAKKVIKILGKPEQVMIIGFVSEWETAPPKDSSEEMKSIHIGYLELVGALKKAKVWKEYKFGKGTYGAEIDSEDNKLMPTYE